jgi:hypothetical protein
MTDTIETKNEGAGMKQGHVLDLKLPIGWLIGGYGALLTVYGLLTKKETYAVSLGLNVNLVWGILMLAVGGAFLLAVFLKKKRG